QNRKHYEKTDQEQQKQAIADQQRDIFENATQHDANQVRREGDVSTRPGAFERPGKHQVGQEDRQKRNDAGERVAQRQESDGQERVLRNQIRPDQCGDEHSIQRRRRPERESRTDKDRQQAAAQDAEYDKRVDQP